MTLEALQRLSRDERIAAKTMSDDEARYLVDSYYMMQEMRKRSANQVRAMGDEPHEVVAWLATQSNMLENQLKGALDRYSDAHPVGRWARSIVGIGPVISAGLIAHIDIHQAPTCGHIWNFAGLNPGVKWEKKTKRPWNANLKTLCWKIGESFVKVCNHKDDFYGEHYLRKKEEEATRNEAGAFADQAAEILRTKNISKTTDAYKAYSVGKLPPAHIHARAKRYAVKLFLSHLHHVWYEIEHGEPPPKPYAIAILEHGHYIAPPNWSRS